MGTNFFKNRSNLINCVIIGPLWVKYGPKTLCQPLAAQNPGLAPAMNNKSKIFASPSEPLVFDVSGNTFVDDLIKEGHS